MARQIPPNILAARCLFVYAKGGKITCRSLDEEKPDDTWKHTATIDPALWIEEMANGRQDASDMLDTLNFGED